MCSIPAVSGCRQRGCRGDLSVNGVFAATLLLALFASPSARHIPRLADYCPPEPAAGQLTFKSVDSANSACVPGVHDDVGQAVFQCWQQFVIDVEGCQVVMRTTEDQLVGPGRLPCRLFGVSGNLTGEGIEAQMWAQVDGPALLSYYSREPEAVAALRYENSAKLVKDIWAFMRYFTGDLRFDDDSWINDSYEQEPQQEQQQQRSDIGDTAAAQEEEEQQEVASSQERPQRRRRQQLASTSSAMAIQAAGDSALASAFSSSSSSSRRERHGPMRVYRSSETRVVVKVPTGCKYRYTVNPDSQVFDSPARHHAHVEWRTLLLTAAALSCVVAVVGLGTCTYLSRRHAEYVSSYWEYQAVKDQLGSELPSSTYVRLFGEQPKSVAGAQEAAVTQAAPRSGGGGGGGGRRGATPAAAPPPASAATAPRSGRPATAAAGGASPEVHAPSASAQAPPASA